MRLRLILTISLVAVAVGHRAVRAQHRGPVRPNLQGTWNGSTLTPLQRALEFRNKTAFTPAEAAEFVRTAPDRARARLPTADDRLTQADVDDAFVEAEAIRLDGLRTSLIVDPANGMLPPLLPAAQARVAARPKRSFDDPEGFGLAERCLLGNFGLGGSIASPPMLPSEVIPRLLSDRPDRRLRDDFRGVDTRCAHRARQRHARPAGDPQMVGRFNRALRRRPPSSSTPRIFGSDIHNLNSGERLHVVERFTRVDSTTLRYRVTVDDPDTWATAWTAEWPFKASSARMYGIDCHEGNYAIENFLRGARDEERRARPPNR